MSSPSKCPLPPCNTADCLKHTVACVGDHGAKCSSAPSAASARGGGHCRARIVRCSYSSTATDRPAVAAAAAFPSPTTTRPSVTGHGSCGGNGNGDSGRRAAPETTETTKTSTSATATTAATTTAAIRRGAGDARTVADMLDLSASEMELVSQRPVSHVKVQDAAEVQNKFYKFGPLLGRGAFATVMLGTERTTGDKWAIKILNKAQCGATQLALFQREIRILRAVRHPNIIHLERVLESPSALFLVLELCLCELAEVAKKKTTFTENEVRRVVQCVSSAVTYLHHKDIVHRDLKLENLLVASNPADPNDKFYVKVTDFGLSVVRGGVGQENMLQETCGTPVYMAPELFGSRMYSQQCDIWAMGVIMYVMLTGKFPFEQKANKPLPMVVAQDEPDFSGPAFKGDDKEPLKKLLRKMLEKNPAYRANAHDVETDPWTRNAPAEEAPAENAMELMRMWRKDLRQPSIRGSLGGFSSDRRSSRMSALGGPPNVLGRDARPRAGSLGQEIATTASGSVRRKVGKGRMPGETRESVHHSVGRTSSPKSRPLSQAYSSDNVLSQLDITSPPDTENETAPKVKWKEVSNKRLGQPKKPLKLSNEFKRLEELAKSSDERLKSSKSSKLKSTDKPLRRSKEWLSRPTQWLKRTRDQTRPSTASLKQSSEPWNKPSKSLKPSSSLVKPSSEPLKKPSKPFKKPSEPFKKPSEPFKKPSEPFKKPSKSLKKSNEPLKKSSEPLTQPSLQSDESSQQSKQSSSDLRLSVQLPFPPRNPKRGVRPKYEKVTVPVAVNYVTENINQYVFNLRSNASHNRSETKIDPSNTNEGIFTSADGTIIQIIQPAKRFSLLYEHKTIKHFPSRTAPLSASKSSVPGTRSTKTRRPSRVLFQPSLQTPLHTSSLPSTLDQYPSEDSMKTSQIALTGPKHPRRESPFAGHPLLHTSLRDKHFQLEDLFDRHWSSSSHVRNASFRRRFSLLLSGRTSKPLESRLLRRGLVAVDESRARDVAKRGSSIVLLPPGLAPPIVYTQPPERRKTVFPVNTSEEELSESTSRRPYTRRSTQSERMSSRITPEIEMWPVTS